MDDAHSTRLKSAPPIRRGSMVPRPWMGFTASIAAALRRQGTSYGAGNPPEAWERAAARRRCALLAAIVLSAFGAATVLAEGLPAGGYPPLRIALVALYTLLFAWVTAGFATAMMGVIVQWCGDRHALSAAPVMDQPVRIDARTAMVMPICNENVATAFAGIAATYEQLAATGAARLFDLYVLSDTSDPEIRAAEEEAWGTLRATLRDGARVYYRWRQRRTRRKAGNVADFCRRWGRNYRYMVVLDADSVMSGNCLVSLVQLMEAHPRAGILQTVPRSWGLSTLHARAQQFAGRVTGQLFTAGMQYWQLGESHYWGHNAIIRIEPFMKHCGLAPLRGRGGLAGDILSHDFVEAALMRRAGWHVWLVPDLEGSYEQQPPNLLEELKRDRRWCQGNLQNARLVAEPGLHPVHRAMLATGAMAYLSAPLWLAFVLLGALSWLVGGPSSIVARNGVPAGMLALWTCTVAMLVLPRVMGVLTLVLRGEATAYGGGAALVKGALLEGTLSVLQAPLRMVAHSIFVAVALTGWKLDWKSPPREAEAIPWADAARRFAPITALVALVLAGALALHVRMALWLLPVALPLLLAAPLAVLTSGQTLGERIRAAGLLLTPEESRPPRVLRRTWARVQLPALVTLLVDMPSPIITVPDDRPAANSDYGPLAQVSGRRDERARHGHRV
jgi:membrane glycosyltransferase